MGQGILIALEGVDGAGKSTMAGGLAAILARFGRRVLLTREPTFGVHGRRLREYLAGSERHLSPAEELALFQADRREHVEEAIRPALARGWVIITDRYYYSSAAYQGALGLDPREILRESETFAPRPDLVVIFTLPLTLALSRCLTDRSSEVQVTEVPPYLEQVAAIYDTFQGPHLKRLDAAPPASQVLGRLFNLALDVLGGRDEYSSPPPN
ncbi:MAG: dTMP kinase [Desulfobaccales bacterium]